MSEEKKIDNNKSNKDFKSKEMLYSLFYEITSEIKGCKIEIDEDEFKENIKNIKFEQLIKYLHEQIQILIKQKTTEAKNEQKKKDEELFYNKDNNNLNTPFTVINQYENSLLNLEFKEKKLIKKIFQYKLQKEAMENKICEYMEMEEEFEEMKTKLKYEDGKFLNNDIKDNEILILRKENINLKKEIKDLETQIKNIQKTLTDKNNENLKLTENIKQLNQQLDEKQKEINLFSLNLNNNNNNNSLSCKYSYNNNNIINKLDDNYNHSTNHKSSENSPGIKVFHFQKTQLLKKGSRKNFEFLSNTRNESLEKTKLDLINKYFTSQHKNNNKNSLNNSCIKITRIPLTNNIRSNKQNNINFNKNNSTNNIFRDSRLISKQKTDYDTSNSATNRKMN